MGRTLKEGVKIEQRRRIVAELYLQSQKQADIARQLGVAQSTVSLDLRMVRKDAGGGGKQLVGRLHEREYSVQRAGRLENLTIHHGRHTFMCHALAGGRTLAEVRDAAGHANVSITSGYLHVAIDDEEAVGNLFCYG